jgi:hypothetical protein
LIFLELVSFLFPTARKIPRFNDRRSEAQEMTLTCNALPAMQQISDNECRYDERRNGL